ncbi:MAG: orotate phosphoribosyltransferase [Spirochaetaceae bacterium]|jgi:orotate phosphoribosyltransferase|nr:orotate phosphoribosyltransferase [Spirochaetaceae bacterium]
MDTIAILKECGALLEGHFLLSSGRHSDRYFQCARLLQYPDRAAAALAPVADAVRAAISGGALKVDAIAGPAIGGILVAYELGRQLGFPAIFTERNDSGRMTLRRGFELSAGMNILIAEDVVTTGKSSAECAAVLREYGVLVSALACVVDRRADPDRAGAASPLSELPLFAAVKITAADWDAQDCALCKQGVPLVKPGSRPGL